MFNALTVDVEDYYMVSAFADVIQYEDWYKYESRVEQNTRILLDLFNEYSVRATFFVLGWVAEHYPEIVRNIHAAGHEIACHGYRHRLVYDMTPEEFRGDVRTAKRILEDITGTSVIGYRAASYSVIKKTLWALDILIEEGFLYDSSIFPIHHDRYGLQGADRFFHVIRRGNESIMEFPPATYHILGQNIPVAGGGYLRLYPFMVTRTAVKRINQVERKPVNIYIHPWEIDTDQPRLNGRLQSRVRHYIKLGSTLSKVRNLLTEFRFKPLAEFLVSLV